VVHVSPASWKLPGGVIFFSSSIRSLTHSVGATRFTRRRYFFSLFFCSLAGFPLFDFLGLVVLLWVGDDALFRLSPSDHCFRTTFYGLMRFFFLDNLAHPTSSAAATFKLLHACFPNMVSLFGSASSVFFLCLQHKSSFLACHRPFSGQSMFSGCLFPIISFFLFCIIGSFSFVVFSPIISFPKPRHPLCAHPTNME